MGLDAGIGHHFHERALGDGHHVQAQLAAHLEHGDVVAVLGDEVGRLGAYLAAAANDDGAGVDDRLAKQDVLGENGVLDAGDGRGEGLGAGGDHDGVGFIGGDEVLIYLLAKVDVDIELLEAGAQAADVHGQLTLPTGKAAERN